MASVYNKNEFNSLQQIKADCRIMSVLYALHNAEIKTQKYVRNVLLLNEHLMRNIVRILRKNELIDTEENKFNGKYVITQKGIDLLTTRIVKEEVIPKIKFVGLKAAPRTYEYMKTVYIPPASYCRNDGHKHIRSLMQ